MEMEPQSGFTYRSIQADTLEQQSRQYELRRRWLWALIGLVGGIIIGAVAYYVFQKLDATADEDPDSIYPPAVKWGDSVAFLSPASNLDDYQPTSSYIANVTVAMNQLGLNPFFSEYSFTHFGYFSGTDDERTYDVMTAFKNKSQTIIIANRGGWGCNRLLDMLDYDAIAANPKVLMGYSDLTGLLNAIHHMTGLITFHGPMGIDPWDNNYYFDYTNQVIFQGQTLTYTNPPEYNWTTIVPGKAKGIAIGGNLSVFVAMLGSAYLPTDFTNRILFLEEVGEDPYRIDRMMTSLHTAGVFDQVEAVVFGQCTDCGPNWTNDTDEFTWIQVLQMRLGPLPIPSYIGAMFGHDLEAQFILPIGALVQIDATEGTITMLESAVKIPFPS